MLKREELKREDRNELEEGNDDEGGERGLLLGGAGSVPELDAVEPELEDELLETGGGMGRGGGNGKGALALGGDEGGSG